MGSGVKAERALETFISRRFGPFLTNDKEAARAILKDKPLINTILNGPRPGEKTARQIIMAYLEAGCVGTD